jgi:hypothetical protein
MIRTIVKEKIFVVAIDRWHMTFREVKAWTSPPKVDYISLSCVEVVDGMLQPAIVVFGRGRVRLRQLNTGKSNIRAASCHGPDEFANAVRPKVLQVVFGCRRRPRLTRW